MTENMKNFLTKVSKDAALVEKIGKLDKAELIEMAKELGVELTEADFVQPEGEVSEAEMDAVVGGYRRCVCVGGGGGKEDSEGELCVCVIGGGGISKVDGEARCACVHAGTGYESFRDVADDIKDAL